MKFSVINFACLTSFVVCVHSQTRGPPHSASFISLKHLRSYVDGYSHAVDEYTDGNPGNVENFVDRTYQFSQALQGGKKIVDCFSNLTAVQTAYLRHPLGYLINHHAFIVTHLEHKKREIKKASLCETTRNQLTDINTNIHALIKSIYSKTQPENLKSLDIAEGLKQQAADAQGRFSEKNCEKNCFEDCPRSCKEDCKKSCKNCKENCVDCEDDCEEDCDSERPK